MNQVETLIKKNCRHSKKAFTLIEMMVSISLFSIVLIVVMGSIITVIDVNRKSQTLSNVMNDVNFALESINRTVVTGELLTPGSAAALISITSIDQNSNKVTYSRKDDVNGRGYIERTIDPEDASLPTETVELTSKEVDINTLNFHVFDNTNNMQPRVLVLIEGEAKTAKDITSTFRIQTSIGQRNLDTADLYN